MKEVALAGCIVFGLTDWLDGYIARTFNQKTVLGEFLDPMADKVLIGALTVGLTIKGLIPIPLAAVIIGRDIALIGCSFYIRNKERPKGAPFFDTTDSATFQIVPSKLSKINTGLQFSLLTVSLMHFSTGIPSLAFIEPFWWLTAVSTLWSGVSYLDGTGLKRLSEPRKYRNDDDDKSSK
jgi:cardiolipin synthase